MRPYAAPKDGEPFRLLVFGGSQGAHVFLQPRARRRSALLPDENRRRITVVQQARPEDFEATREALARLGIEAEIEPFFTDMGERLADGASRLCRAGASTVAELAAIGRPAILVPYPHALDHDQAENARVLAEAGGAWLVPEQELTPTELARRLSRSPGISGASSRRRRRCGAARRAGSTRPSGWPTWSRALQPSEVHFRPSAS